MENDLSAPNQQVVKISGSSYADNLVFLDVRNVRRTHEMDDQ